MLGANVLGLVECHRLRPLVEELFDPMNVAQKRELSSPEPEARHQRPRHDQPHQSHVRDAQFRDAAPRRATVSPHRASVPRISRSSVPPESRPRDTRRSCSRYAEDGDQKRDKSEKPERGWRRERVLFIARARKEEAMMQEQEAEVVAAHDETTLMKSEVFHLQELAQRMEGRCGVVQELCHESSREIRALNEMQAEAAEKLRHEYAYRFSVLTEEHHEKTEAALAEAWLRTELSQDGDRSASTLCSGLEEKCHAARVAELGAAAELAEERGRVDNALQQIVYLREGKSVLKDELVDFRASHASCAELEGMIARFQTEQSCKTDKVQNLEASASNLAAAIRELQRCLSCETDSIHLAEERQRSLVEEEESMILEADAEERREEAGIAASEEEILRDLTRNEELSSELLRHMKDLESENMREKAGISSMSSATLAQVEMYGRKIQESRVEAKDAADDMTAMHALLAASKHEEICWKQRADQRRGRVQAFAIQEAEMVNKQRVEDIVEEERSKLEDEELQELRSEIAEQRAASRHREQRLEGEISKAIKTLQEQEARSQDQNAQICAAAKKELNRCLAKRVEMCKSMEEASTRLRSALSAEHADAMERQSEQAQSELNSLEAEWTQAARVQLTRELAESHKDAISRQAAQMKHKAKREHNEEREALRERLSVNETVAGDIATKDAAAKQAHATALKAAQERFRVALVATEANCEAQLQTTLEEAEARLAEQRQAEIAVQHEALQVDTRRKALQAAHLGVLQIEATGARKAAPKAAVTASSPEMVLDTSATVADAEVQKEFWYTWMSERSFWLDLVTERVERKLVSCATPVQPALVASNLYVSGAQVLNDHAFLRANRVTLIFSCQSRDECSAGALPKGIVRKHLQVPDAPWYPILKMHLPEVCYDMSRLPVGERALIHCKQGVNRSCALAVAVVMWKTKGCSTPVQLLEKSWLQVAVARGDAILTNWGFRMQLFILATALLDGAGQGFASAWPSNWGPELWIGEDTLNVPRPERPRRKPTQAQGQAQLQRTPSGLLNENT